MRRGWIKFWILLPVLVGILFFVHKTRVRTKEVTHSPILNTTTPCSNIERFNLIETVDGIKKWELTSDKAQFLEEKIELSRINLTFFEKERPILRLYGEKGTLGRKKRDIRVYPYVEVIGEEDKAKLTTSSLFWQADIGVFTTEDRFTLIKDGIKIHGCGLIMDPKMEKLEIKKVKIEINPECISSVSNSFKPFSSKTDVRPFAFTTNTPQ